MLQFYLESFLKMWLDEKASAQKVITENGRFNKRLKLGHVAHKSHPKDRKSFKLKEMGSHQVICHNLPDQLREKCGLTRSTFKIQGSIGQGNLAEIPWVCLFDTSISTSAQKGYYIVFLFDAQMNGVYLSLNQGWTQYHDQFGDKEGRRRIKSNALHAKRALRSDDGFDYAEIKLNTTNALGKGYEAGNICSKYYPAGAIPDDLVLIDDIRNLVGVYRELKGLVGTDIFSIGSLLTEDQYQNLAQPTTNQANNPESIPKKGKRSRVGEAWSRDPNMAAIALANAGFVCEFDSTHTTFTSARSGQQFLEAHHLIPMEFQDSFEISIDVPENIVGLCPNCHRAIHNSIVETRKGMISIFMRSRKEGLSQRGIEIQEKDLLALYGRKEEEGVQSR